MATANVKQIEFIAEGRKLAAEHSLEALLVATANRVTGDPRVNDKDAAGLVIWLTGLFTLLTDEPGTKTSSGN